MLVTVLLIVQTVAAVGLILVGSLVEAYGYGLSLGTNWPYHQNIFGLALKGDPEAWHRIIATTLGIIAVLLAILKHDMNTFSGLALIAATALLGAATLNVLAGKLPAFLHGFHGLLAYTTLLCYLSELQPGSPPVWSLMDRLIPLHAFLLMIFLGGMVTGQRGYQKAIGTFIVPRSAGQWVLAIHFLVWLLLVLTLAYYVDRYNVALLFVLLQAVVGVMLYQSVNASPSKPGILAVFHQGTAMLILLAVFFGWRVVVPFLG